MLPVSAFQQEVCQHPRGLVLLSQYSCDSCDSITSSVLGCNRVTGCMQLYLDTLKSCNVTSILLLIIFISQEREIYDKFVSLSAFS